MVIELNIEKEEETVWISAQEASEILHISKTYFYQLFKDKKIPVACVKIGRAPKFRKKDVEAYFDSLIFEANNKHKEES